jgi:hypothetical protein
VGSFLSFEAADTYDLDWARSASKDMADSRRVRREKKPRRPGHSPCDWPRLPCLTTDGDQPPLLARVHLAQPTAPMSQQTTATPPAGSTGPSGSNASPGQSTSAPTPPPSGSGGSAASSSTTSRLSIPQTAPAGGLTITQPPETATSFFKIAPSQAITVAWNFTSLYSTPAHLTLTAGCVGGNSYPIGPNSGTIDGTSTAVTFDPYSWNQANPNLPFPQATCTLSIWDDRGPNALRAPGLFAMNTNLKFALYKPQDYTPLASGASLSFPLNCLLNFFLLTLPFIGWQCTACEQSSALARFTAHPAFAAIIATLVVMLLSGYGLLRRH